MRHPSGKAKAAMAVRRSSQIIWAIGVALIVATLVGCSVAIWDLRQQALEQQRTAIRNLGVVLAEQTTRYLQVVDLVLQEVQSRVTGLGVRSGEELGQSFGTDAIRDFLRARLRALPQANAFSLLKADGRILVTSRPHALAGLDFSDRDYYRHFADADNTGPFISSPTNSRLAGTPTIYLARKLTGPTGNFLGIALGAIDLQYLTGFYQAIDLPPGEIVTLLRRDGMVVARYPDETRAVGRQVPESSPWHELASGQGGAFRSPGLFGAMPALVSVHPLHAWPLVVNVAMQERVALARWREQTTIIALIGLGTASGFAALFGIVARQFRRKTEQNTRLLESTEALRSSEARIRDFVEMSSDWLWELDAEFRLTWVSDNPMTSLLGLSRGIGLRPWEAFGDDPSDHAWLRFRDLLRAGRPLRDSRHHHAGQDGIIHHVSINGNPVLDAAGKLIGYRGTGRDITAEVQAEDDLRAAKESSDAASRAKSEFLANMSHELRTPLNAIIGFSELIHDQPFGQIGTNYVEYATDINNAGHHLLDVINDVLDLSKIEAGRYELADETVELGMVVRTSIAMLKLRAREGGVRIDNELNGSRVAVRGDGRALKQIVLNLLSNAVKFTPDGGSVSLSIEHDATQVVLVVRDTGIGIEPAVLNVLCEPFRQADAAISRKFGGSGLGLAICRKLLALHGGTLTIESTPGTGTTVRVALPAERVVEATSIMRSVKPETLATASPA